MTQRLVLLVMNAWPSLGLFIVNSFNLNEHLSLYLPFALELFTFLSIYLTFTVSHVSLSGSCLVP